MADSNITVSGLIISAGVGQLALRWTVNNPNQGGLPYLDIATVEVFASATNDRVSATKIGEGLNAFLHAGVTPGQTRYYWIRARDVSGQFGDWFPLSATGGIAGTAGTAQPGPGTITATELAPDSVTSPAIAPAAVGASEIANAAIVRAKIAFAAVGSAEIEDAAITNAKIANASIDNAKIANLSADKITFGTLSGIAITSVTINGGTITGGTISGTTFSGGTFNGGTFNGVQMNSVEIDSGRITASIIRTRTSFPSISIEESSGFGTVALYVNASSGQVARLSTVTSGPVLDVNRASASQFAASFRNTSAGAVSGSSPTWAFYANAGAYGPFTASHELLWPIDTPLPEIGDVVMDDALMFRKDVSNTLFSGKLSRHGRPAIGVFAACRAWGRTAAMPDDLSDEALASLGEKYRLILVNAVGEGQVNVCGEGGHIEAGDLLVASGTPGKATKQHDDIWRASTVARARESVVFDDRDFALVACVYKSG